MHDSMSKLILSFCVYICYNNRDQNEDDDREEEQEKDLRGHRLVLPEDGFEWKKYGQKFIKTIRKFRSYFKCQDSGCIAKKRAEWCTSDPTNIRIVYDGNHTHDGSSSSSADRPRRGSSNTASDANQYNLLTQVFGDQSSNSPPAGRRN